MSETDTIEKVEPSVDGQQVEARRLEIEAEARRQGWRPKEEFTGSGPWVDAEEFVERGKQFSHILKQENRELKQQVGDFSRRLDESGKVFEEFRKYHESSVKQAYERAKRDLEVQRDEAVRTSDVDGFKRHQAELDELERQKPTPTPETARAAPQQAADPYVQEWVAANPWFVSDLDAQSYARAVDARLGDSLPLRERLDEVRRSVAKRFPEHFGNARREAPVAVAAPANGGGGRAPKKGPSYDDLPADAKKQCDRFVGQKLLTRETYVRDYFEQA